MSPPPPAGSAFDLAVAAVLDAPDRAGLAIALCEGVAMSVSAPLVTLAEVGATGTTEIARSGPEDSSAENPTTTFTVHTSQPEVILLVHRTLDEDGREVCRLLIDLTAAALARLQSEELVADHEDRFRRLSDKLRQVVFDSPAELSDSAAVPDLAVAASMLTQREREVLEQIVAGASNAAIAEKYTLSIETVKTHVKHILRKMGATNRAELIARSM